MTESTTKPVRLNTTSVDAMEATLYAVAVAHMIPSENGGLLHAHRTLSENPDDFYDYFSEAARLSCVRHNVKPSDWADKDPGEITQELTFGQTSKSGEWPHLVWSEMENTVLILGDLTLSDPWQRVMCFGDPANMIQPLLRMGAMVGAFTLWINPEDTEYSSAQLVERFVKEATAAYRAKRGL